VGFKLAEGKGLREGWNSKELWKSVEKAKDWNSGALAVRHDKEEESKPTALEPKAAAPGRG